MSSVSTPLSNKLVCRLLFTKKSKDEFVCSTCSKVCKSAHGYTNLIAHLRSNHPTYLEDASQAARNRNALRLRVVDDETRNIFRWCEWVVMDRLPLAFVERKMTRKNASLPSISEKTLKSYLVRVYQSTEARVAEELPPSFGIVLDGSTFNGRHYIAIFAVFDDPTMCHGTPSDDVSEYFDDTDCFTRRFLLLALCPLDVEEDLGAQSLFDLIADTLSRYNKPWEAVTFMVADNCNVNQYIGSREGAITMVGAESDKAHSLLKVLNDFEGVTKTLQRSTLTLSGTRRLFNLVIQRYPKLKPRLSATAAIVNYAALETGIVKLQRKEALTPAERAACVDFRRADETPSLQVPPSDLSIVQQAFKKRKTTKRSRYVDVAFIPPTSNECERFFSSAKLVYSDLRKRLDASTLEMLMYLMYNKDMWDVYTVEALRS
ncbi:hypothetical protein PR003_g28662 [Phytophthora rubi]|uniref:Uncharacterized protein n=1 Tax=Phytophthora rubi TaxID=129364 RepID=A0A6A4BTX4_9STRA|nr:hypothetical protein PR001_g27526 [Phytophthora rubi]KAE9277913.1 hypothetical protein PR003_g28662 [Phytophthora rubi]